MSTRLCELLLSSTTMLEINWSNARKPCKTVADLNEIMEAEVEDGETLKEELSNCQHFLLFAGKNTLCLPFSIFLFNSKS